ncbi:GAF domain-containing protein [Marininema halotolerans]|uniref:GAF domain-containing protein n=1 Tax=Marininema halotolerans TaxID=1155944 RepID=A0A1I6QFA9_9BACL|nr:GAF domain-containing protein [Marininema halotolerans]SFS51025.1 GAF domain-containing protein [Marininema halotolerans]
MDAAFIFKIIIDKPWLAYTLLGFCMLLSLIILWRAKNGDSLSFLGLHLQSDKGRNQLENRYTHMREESKQKSYVIQSLTTLAAEIGELIALYDQKIDSTHLENQRRHIYTFLLSCVVAVMAGKKANNPKVCIFIDAGEGNLRVHEAATHSPSGMRKLRLSIADSAAGYTYHTGEIFFSGQIHTPGSRFRVHPKAQTMYNSLICVPIKLGEKVLGVLSVTGDEERSYTEGEKEILNAFASVVSPLLARELQYKPTFAFPSKESFST